MHEASWGAPLKVAMSAQKALQGFKTETRKLLEGTEKISVPLTRWFTYVLSLVFDCLRPPDVSHAFWMPKTKQYTGAFLAKTNFSQKHWLMKHQSHLWKAYWKRISIMVFMSNTKGCSHILMDDPRLRFMVDGGDPISLTLLMLTWRLGR